MALRHYPKEIEELMEIWEPYEDKVKDGVMRDAPKEAIEALISVKNGHGNRTINNKSTKVGFFFYLKSGEMI